METVITKLFPASNASAIICDSGEPTLISVSRPPAHFISPSTTAAAVAATVYVGSFASPSPPPFLLTTTNTTPPAQRPQRKAAEECVEKLSKSGDLIDATDMFKDDTVETIYLAIAVRWAIVHIYTVVLGSPQEIDNDVTPPKEQWTGQSGIFAEIRTLMPGWKEEEDIGVAKVTAKGKFSEEQARTYHLSNRHKQIKRIVECIDLCKSLGVKFDGEIKWKK